MEKKFKMKVKKKRLKKKVRKALKTKIVTRSYTTTTLGKAQAKVGGPPAKRQEKRGRLALDAARIQKRKKKK